MANQRTFLETSFGLLALSALLVPNVVALSVDDVAPLGKAVDDSGLGAVMDSACSGEGTIEQDLYGTLSINRLGHFPLVVKGASNGCGGNGCDDTFTGEFASNGASDRRVGMNEGYRHDSSGNCEVACLYVGAHPDNQYNTEYPNADSGFISVDVKAKVVRFSCVRNDTGEWLYSGHASLNG